MMKEFIGTLCGGIVMAGFVSLFAILMSSALESSGTEAGNIWAAAMGLIIVFLAIMALWHRIFASRA